MGHNLDRAAHARFDRAEQSCAVARRLQDGMQQERTRGLAVGAGHPHHCQRLRRLALQSRGHQCHCQPRVGDVYLRHVQSQRPLDQQRRRAVRNGLGCKVVAVRVYAAEAREHAAARGEVGAVDDPVDVDDLGNRTRQAQVRTRNARAELREDHRRGDATKGPRGPAQPGGIPSVLKA